MKIKTLILSAVLAGSFTFAKAQNFQNGDMVANLGLGFGWYSYGYGVSSFPAISLSLEKGIKELDFGNLGIGGIVAYKHASYSWLTSYDWSWTDILVAARGAIHADVLHVDKLDTYAGAVLGLRLESYKYYTLDNNFNYVKAHENNPKLVIGFFVGGRYYFTDNFAVFGDFGYGYGYATLGVSYKF